MAESKKNEEKKIIVDEDWKKEAQKEKEILAAQEQAETEEEQVQKQRGPLPKGNLAALVSMLTTQAFFALGLLKLEGQDEKEPDLEMAKYNIDMLETLEEKTKGNLTDEEAAVLEKTLYELRMTYVKVSG